MTQNQQPQKFDHDGSVSATWKMTMGKLAVHFHPEAYLNEGQHTIYVVNACGPCDVIGTKIRLWFGNNLECKVATEMVGVEEGSEAYKLMKRP